MDGFSEVRFVFDPNLRSVLTASCHSILVGYSCYYLTRNSLTFTAPAMVASPSLGLDITSIGVITSIFPLCYGCSKFVSGVVGDTLSPGVMLGGGLIATGMVRTHSVSDRLRVHILIFSMKVNIAFGASSTLPLFCILWATNGILSFPFFCSFLPNIFFLRQACFRALVLQVARRYLLPGLRRKKEGLIGSVYPFRQFCSRLQSFRSILQGMWNISHNLGGFAAPLLAGTAARTLGWNVRIVFSLQVFLFK